LAAALNKDVFIHSFIHSNNLKCTMLFRRGSGRYTCPSVRLSVCLSRGVGGPGEWSSTVCATTREWDCTQTNRLLIIRLPKRPGPTCAHTAAWSIRWRIRIHNSIKFRIHGLGICTELYLFWLCAV